MPQQDTYDLVVIGGGSGGIAHAQRAAEYGARVAVVESHRLGGTCVNVGCVPKKVMWHAADIAQALGDAAAYGFKVEQGPHDWAALKRARDAYVLRLNGIYESNLARRNVELIRGRARFLGPRTVAVGELVLQTRYVTIATGGRPILPALPGADLGITSDTFFDLPARPPRIAIVGSGYVAAELGSVFGALGSEVTLVLRGERLLRDFDPILSETLMAHMRAQGMQILTKVTLGGLRPAQSRSPGGELELYLPDGSPLGCYDSVLWAVGREPVTLDLDLPRAGVTLDPEGFIPTDPLQETNVPCIFAVGDVTGREALTPVAIAAGRRLSDRVFGGQAGRKLEYHTIPTVIFTHPTIGTVGCTEAQARERHADVRVYRSSFVPLYHGVMERKPRSEMKLIAVGPEERIVGLHVIGPGADEMLQGFAVAVRMGARKVDFDDTVAIHPTSAEELVTMR